MAADLGEGGSGYTYAERPTAPRWEGKRLAIEAVEQVSRSVTGLIASVRGANGRGLSSRLPPPRAILAKLERHCRLISGTGHCLARPGREAGPRAHRGRTRRWPLRGRPPG